MTENKERILELKEDNSDKKNVEKSRGSLKNSICETSEPMEQENNSKQTHSTNDMQNSSNEEDVKDSYKNSIDISEATSDPKCSKSASVLNCLNSQDFSSDENNSNSPVKRLLLEEVTKKTELHFSPFVQVSKKPTIPVPYLPNLPYLPTLPWMNHMKPLPPLESLMPPNIKQKKSPVENKPDTPISNKSISFILKADKIPVPTTHKKNILSEFDPLLSIAKNYSKQSLCDIKQTESVNKTKKSKHILLESEDSTSSTSSLNIESSSSSEDEKKREYSSCKSKNDLINRKVFPKYGETKPTSPINYEIMRKSLPKTSSHKDLKRRPGKYTNNNFDENKIHKKNLSLDKNEINTLQYYKYDEALLKEKHKSNYSSNKDDYHKKNSEKTKTDKNDDKLYVNKKKKYKYWNDSKKTQGHYSKNNKDKFMLKDNASHKSKKYSDDNSSSERIKSRNNTTKLLKHEDLNVNLLELKTKIKDKYKERHSSRLKSYNPNAYEYSKYESRKYSKGKYEDDSTSDSDRESGECSSSSSESEIDSPLQEVDNNSKVTNEGEDIKLNNMATKSVSPNDTTCEKSIVYQSNSNLDNDDLISTSSNNSRSSGKAVPLQKRLGIPIEDNFINNSGSNNSTEYQETKIRKGPHTPDYPYEKSPSDDENQVVKETSSKTNVIINRENIKPTSIINKANRLSTCNYTINHYKPAYSGDTSNVKVKEFRLEKQELVPKSNFDSKSASNIYNSGQTNIKESPVRTNLDARLKTMFGIKNSSSEDSPVKIDSSIQQVKFFKPLKETPSPFRSRNTYLHWYKETYRYKKVVDSCSYKYIDPNQKIKIGIQIKEFSEDSSSDEEKPESSCTLQDLGISPPRFNRVQQILNFDDNPHQSQLSSKNSGVSNVVKMTISPNSELELNFAGVPHNVKDCKDTNSSKLMDIVVSRLLYDLKSSFKREITDDILDDIISKESHKRSKID